MEDAPLARPASMDAVTVGDFRNSEDWLRLWSVACNMPQNVLAEIAEMARFPS